MEWGSYVEGAQCYVSKRRHAQQPYSVFTIDGHPFVVMWDTCCTVRGLIGETKARKLLAKQADSIKSVVWLDEPRPVGGVADGVAAYIVGTEVRYRSTGPLWVLIIAVKYSKTTTPRPLWRVASHTRLTFVAASRGTREYARLGPYKY